MAGTPSSRKDDLWEGTCNATGHGYVKGGTIVEGSLDVLLNGKPNARKGDKVVATCGHEGIISSGSPDCTINGVPDARVGDTVTGLTIDGIITTGSPDSGSN